MPDTQGLTKMVEDYYPTVEEIVQEFYANLYQKHDDSFRTWISRREIEVTPTLISNISGAPLVSNPVYPWPVDHHPTRVKIVECFAEGRPYHMKTEGEGSFQMSDLSNDV
jgi:hypothetical protein